jgi:hypothetical protein
MSFRGFIQQIKFISNDQGKCDLPLPEQFRAILAKERARSDRNGHGFSVAIFRVGKDRVAGSGQTLGSILRDKMRNTDEVGWFNKDSIGVLLYNTGKSGAWEFVKNVRFLIDQQNIPHTCTVYLYPDDWARLDNHADHQSIKGGSEVNGQVPYKH